MKRAISVSFPSQIPILSAGGAIPNQNHSSKCIATRRRRHWYHPAQLVIRFVHLQSSVVGTKFTHRSIHTSKYWENEIWTWTFFGKYIFAFIVVDLYGTRARADVRRGPFSFRGFSSTLDLQTCNAWSDTLNNSYLHETDKHICFFIHIHNIFALPQRHLIIDIFINVSIKLHLSQYNKLFGCFNDISHKCRPHLKSELSQSCPNWEQYTVLTFFLLSRSLKIVILHSSYSKTKGKKFVCICFLRI